MHVKITRIRDNGVQTLGELQVIDNNRVVFTCKTLELPYINNERGISCIPAGSYIVTKRYSEKYGRHFLINDVPNRSYILIHQGNFHTQIRGCILVGSAFADINKDGQLDVVNSKYTLTKLLNILPEKFELEILPAIYND